MVQPSDIVHDDGAGMAHCIQESVAQRLGILVRIRRERFAGSVAEPDEGGVDTVHARAGHEANVEVVLTS